MENNKEQVPQEQKEPPKEIQKEGEVEEAPSSNIITQSNNFVPQPVQYNKSRSFSYDQYNQYAQQTPSPAPGLNLSKSIKEKLISTKENVVDFLTNNPLKVIKTIDPIDYSGFYDLVQKSLIEKNCKKVDKTEMNDVELHPKIMNPRYIEQGLFKTSYIIYDILTEEKKWLVNRRYSDFLWFRECLLSIFPGEKIAVLPGKKIGNRRFESDFVEKRRERLQLFLDDILSREIFKTSYLLSVFLSCPDRSTFEHQMKLMAPKVLAAKYVEQIKSLDGTIKIFDFEGDNALATRTFFKNLNEYFAYQNSLLKYLLKNLKSYYTHMEEASDNLEQVQLCFGTLFRFNKEANISSKITKTYEEYEAFFSSWKNIMKNQSYIVKDTVNKFFKKVNNNNLSLTELLHTQTVLSEDYENRKIKLFTKKGKLYAQSDVSKWEFNKVVLPDMTRIFSDKAYAFEQMCYDETQELYKTRDLLGYYYSRSIIYFKEIIEQNEQMYVENLNKFSELLEPSLTQSVGVWSSMATNAKVSIS